MPKEWVKERAERSERIKNGDASVMDHISKWLDTLDAPFLPGSIVTKGAKGGATLIKLLRNPKASWQTFRQLFKASKVAGSAINVTEKGLAHVLGRHVAGGAQAAGKSIFSGGAKEVQALVRSAESVAPTLQKGGNFHRIIDAGRTIGIDRASGAPTSVYTVITNKAGELVTAFPGVP